MSQPNTFLFLLYSFKVKLTHIATEVTPRDIRVDRQIVLYRPHGPRQTHDLPARSRRYAHRHEQRAGKRTGERGHPTAGRLTDLLKRLPRRPVTPVGVPMNNKCHIGFSLNNGRLELDGLNVRVTGITFRGQGVVGSACRRVVFSAAVVF